MNQPVWVCLNALHSSHDELLHRDLLMFVSRAWLEPRRRSAAQSRGLKNRRRHRGEIVQDKVSE